MSTDEWVKTRWWRAIGPDGELWAESSDEEEVRELARPGDRIQQLWGRDDRMMFGGTPSEPRLPDLRGRVVS